MKHRQLFVLGSLLILILNIYAQIVELPWLVHTAKLLIYIPLLIGFMGNLDFSNLNLSVFIILSILSGFFQFFDHQKLVQLLILFLSMGSYFFLYRDALKLTKRETASRYMKFFFLFLVLANIYFLFSHLQQMERNMGNMMEFGFYAMYYINLLVLAVVGLIYYLNSYSRKAVYFISLVMAVIFADVFRDMADFYLRDTGVLVIESVLRYCVVFLSLKYFVTPEKKLRLINFI